MFHTPAAVIVIGHTLVDQRPVAVSVAAHFGKSQRIQPLLLLVAGIVAFVQRMAARKLGVERVPDQLEQLQALWRRGVRASEVLVDDVGEFRLLQIRDTGYGERRRAGENCLENCADAVPRVGAKDAAGGGKEEGES